MVDSLARIVAPFDVEVLNAALSGELTLFDVDGRFEASHMGDPKQSSPGPQAFYTKAFLAGMQAIAWFAAHRPVGDPLRAKVPELYEKIRARLQNEALLLMGGFRDGVGDGPGYVYFTPLRLARGGPDERVVLENVTYPVWKSEPFPFPGVYGVYKAFTSEAFARMVERVKTTPLTEGQWEADPRASVPDLVREAMARHKLSEDAATLYLQLLTLADCSDQDVCEINDWKKSDHRLKKAGAELAKATLVVQERKLRSGRDYALPGAWEKLRAPQPGIERDKLTLYDTRMIDEIPAAPLGRILPLAPLHELFAAAWATHATHSDDQDERKPRHIPRARPVAKSLGDAKSEEELIAAIVEGHAKDPNDDGPRLVYADLLTERGDRRGEFIVLACQIAASANIETAMQYRYNQLLEDPETAGISFAQQHTVKLDWDRGFVVGVHMKIPAFVRHGARLMKEHPLLRRLVLNTGLRKIPDGQMETLAACPLVSRITELDFADHFVHSRPFIQFLKSPHLTKLRRLRIGANPRGGGIGKGGLAAIASCAALSDLRVLDLPGQRVGDGGATALAKAANFSKLEVVRLPMNDISDVGAAALLDAAPLSKLRYLELDDARFIQGAGGIYGQRPNRFSPAMLARIRTDPRSDPSAGED